MPFTYYLVDVFAEAPCEGNQLAVVFDNGALTTAVMQRIAREFNFSETTFVAPHAASGVGFDVRIFTPQEELPFAGHPTLGTAYVLQRGILKKRVNEIILNLGVGPIPVTFTYRSGRADILWMRQNPPQFGRTLDAILVSHLLGVPHEEIDTRYPIEEVSTGLPFIIVPLKSLAFLQKYRLIHEGYFKLVEDIEAKDVLFFCPQTVKGENDLHARVFPLSRGIPEDPATGSANGCLAAYLSKYCYFGRETVEARVEQGYEVGRPSLLYLRAGLRNGAIEVNVGGRVQPVARGVLVSIPS
jgi:trans-2,3-dihydro-3-hydroxyanthranilate isomerase